MQDSLRTFSVFVSVLDAQYACELVLETVNGIVGALFTVFDVINMRFVTVCFIVDAENRRTVACTIGFTCNLHLFTGRKRSEGVVDKVNRIIEPMK